MIRKLLLSSAAIALVSASAYAADLPSRKAPPIYAPPPALFTWTGIYVGGQVGYEFGRDSAFVNSTALGYGYSPNGVIGGAHIGYNQQYNQFVVGIEGDVEGTGYKKTAFPGAFVLPTTVSTRDSIQGSVRGRLGFAYDRALFYATGGAAFGGIRDTYATVLGFDSINHTRVGYTIGGGIEYAISNNWSVRAEYRYTDFGRFTDFPVASLPGVLGGPAGVRQHDSDNRVEVGFSYKFDTYAPAAVVAKY